MEQITLHTNDDVVDGAIGPQEIPYTVNTYSQSKDLDWDVIYKLDCAAQDAQHAVYMAAVTGGTCTIMPSDAIPIIRHARDSREIILGRRTANGGLYNARVSTAILSGDVKFIRAESEEQQSLRMTG